MSTASAPQACEAKTDNAKAARQLSPGEQLVREAIAFLNANVDKIDVLVFGCQAKPGQLMEHRHEDHSCKMDYTQLSVDAPHVTAGHEKDLGIHTTVACQGIVARLVDSFHGLDAKVRRARHPGSLFEALSEALGR